jgi:hypothetical protein
MAGSEYTTLPEVKTVAQIPTADESRDELIAFLIPRISRHIDIHCHRHFYAKTATEVYDYQTEFTLWLRGDLHTLTAIQNGDGEAIDITTVFKYPLAGPPYQWIEMNQSSSVTFRWAATTPQQCISVSGIWGFLEDGDTPQAISDACAAWAKYVLQVSKLAGVKSTTIGDYTVSYSNVLDILREGPPNEAGHYLEAYKKRRFATTSREIAP